MDQNQDIIIDYVEIYEKQKREDVKRTFSRFNLSLFLYTAVSYAVVFAAQIIILLLTGQSGYTSLMENIYVQWLLGVGPMYVIGLPLLLLITKSMKTKKREKKSLKFSEFCALFLICEGVMFVGNTIGTTLNSILGGILGHDINNSTSTLIESSPILLIFTVAVVIGPIIEELIFRKLMIDRLSRFGDVVAILVSGVAFGLFHGNFYQFFYSAMLGIILGFVYTKTGKWLYTAILHMVINFFGSVVALPMIRIYERMAENALLLEAGEKIDMLQFMSDAMIVGSYSVIEYAMMISGIILLIYAFMKKKVKVENNAELYLPNGEITKNALINVGTILFVITSMILFAVSVLIP